MAAASHFTISACTSKALLAAGALPCARNVSKHEFSWRSESYGAISNASHATSMWPPTSKGVLKGRVGIWACATSEKINAEQSVIEKDAKERMQKAVETVRSNFNAVRTCRANPAMLDQVMVEYHGTLVSVKSVAQINSPDASTITVQPYDKSSINSIEKAIVSFNLDLTPSNDGMILRLTVDPLTSERRKELSKIVSKQAEDGKVAIRNVRRAAMKLYEKLEKEKKLSKDTVRDLSSDLQKLTDEHIKNIGLLLKQKEKELLTV